MRMYIIFSVTFSGMPSQFLNSGKLGTFLSIDGRSGWSSLLLIKFFIMIAQQMKKVMVYKSFFFFADIYTNHFFDVVCLNKLLQWLCLLPQLSSMRCVLVSGGWCLELIDIFTVFEILFDMFYQMHVLTKSVCFLQYLLSVPLRMFRVWAFTAMLGQVSIRQKVILKN